MKKFLVYFGIVFTFSMIIGSIQAHGAAFDFTNDVSQSGQIWTTAGGGNPSAVYQSFQAPFNGTGTVFFWANNSPGGVDVDIFITDPKGTQAEVNALMLGANNTSCTNFPNTFSAGENVASGIKAQYDDDIQYSLIQGQYYAFCIRGNNGANQTANLFGSPSNDYSLGRASSSANVVQDFAIGFNPNSGVNTLNLVYPADNIHTTDFENWVITHDFASSSFSGQILVYYGQSSSSMNLVDSATISGVGEAVPIVLLKTNYLLPVNAINTSTRWYAQAGYVGNNGLSVSSSISSFLVSTNGVVNVLTGPIVALANPSAGTNPFTNASSSLEADCGWNSLSGCLINAGVFIGNFLFKPSSLSLDAIEFQINSLQSVFPFSAYFSVRDALEDGVATTTTNTSLNIQLAGLTYTNTVNLTFLNSSTLVTAFTTTHCDAACASATRDRVFLYMRLTLWAITGMAIIKIVTKA